MIEKIKVLINKATVDGQPIEVGSPKNESFGDYSTNIALILAKINKEDPNEIANHIQERISAMDKGSVFETIRTAQGFINFRLSSAFLQDHLKQILKSKDKYGSSSVNANKKVLLEFVSANPTGPLHIGHGRWAVIGDCLANILKATGYKTDTEFYVNDAGEQIENLSLSITARINGKEIPEGGYAGAYISQLAEELKNSRNIKLDSLRTLLSQQRTTLDKIGVHFDKWFFESQLHKNGQINKMNALLENKGLTLHEGNALWFKSSEFGDDKNRVLIKDDGSTTYFAADIAYHADKFKRGYDRVINVWGTDHHGYIGRLKAAMTALGYPSEKLEIIIGQLVALYRGKELVRMSKRTGEMITLDEVIDEIGKDETRYFLAKNSPNTHLDFDLELAKSRSMENPVYYVKYAHARIKSILKEASQIGLKPDASVDLSVLKAPEERRLMVKLLKFEDEVLNASDHLQPHRLTNYAEELASIFHNYYHQQRVLSDDKILSKARLTLVLSTSIVIKNVLNLLGIQAPEQM